MSRLIFLKPDIIYFTHSKIRNRFTGCGKYLTETYDEIVKNPDLINKIPKIKVIYNSETNEFYSMNNRRLWVFKKLYEDKKIKEIPALVENIKSNSRIKNNKYSQFAKITFN